VELRRQIAIIWAWFPLLVVSVLLAGTAAFLVSSQLPKTYESKATLIVGQSLSAVNPDYTQVLVSQSLSSTYATVATTRPILENVITKLDLGVTTDELAKNVRADAPVSSTLLMIVAQDGNPSRAAAIANALATALIAASPAIQGRQAEFQQSIDADLQATQDQITATQATVDTLSALAARTPAQDADLATLEGRLVSLRSTYTTLLTASSSNASNLLSVIEPAVAPVAPISPRPLLNTLLAAALGLLISTGVAFGAEYLDDSVKDSDKVQEVANLSTLGTIGRMSGDKGRSAIYRLVTLLYPRSGVAEAYRTLRTNIEFASLDQDAKTLLVTSSIPGEGKTVTAANLAVVFAQAGRRVLLVDADLRKPGVHVIFDLPNAHGLTTLLRSDGISVDAIVQMTEQANLRILTTGPLPPNPAELLGSQRMRTVLDRLKIDEDLVIFDSPPLQAVTDSAILSSFVDGTVFVIDAQHGRRRAVRAAREALAKAGANVLGAVLNRIPARANSDYASYYGGPYEPGRAVERLVRVPDKSSDLPESTSHLPRAG
jgi:succinoglycan biosynthesis transport protein ExoP